MKFVNSKEIGKKIDEIKNILEENISVADLYIDFLDVSNRFNCDSANIVNSFCQACNLDKTDVGIQRLIEDYKIDKPVHLNISEYKNNPYYRNITIKNIKSSKWKYLTLSYKAFEAFTYKDTTDSSDYREITHLGYFDEKFSFPAIIEKDEVWMSITPHEILTMKEPVEKAHGNVLTYGLGLGYYAYMVSLKQGVKSVTIIEKDSRAIEMFNTYILPQFSNKNKIKIIQADALDYSKKHPNYDYTFIDLWHTVDDGLPLYLKLKEVYKDDSSCDYWIENSMLFMIRRYLISLIIEQYEGSEESNYLNSDNFEDELFSKLYTALKDIEIKTVSDLDSCLSFNNIKKIVEGMKW